MHPDSDFELFSLIMGQFNLENRDIRFSLHRLLDNYPLFILIETETNKKFELKGAR